MVHKEESKLDEILDMLRGKTSYLSDELDRNDMLLGRSVRGIIDEKLSEGYDFGIEDLLSFLDGLLECETCCSELTLARLITAEVKNIINPPRHIENID